MNEKDKFLKIITDSLELYHKYGARSSKKTDKVHYFFKNVMEQYLPKNHKIELEKRIKCSNHSGFKRCDIVLYKNNIPCIIFPVKVIMSNFYQNKNNYYENLLGDITSIIHCNPDIKFIPINISFCKIPYLMKNKKIKKFELISSSIFKPYNELIKRCDNVVETINYLIELDYENIENELYDKYPIVKSLSNETPWKNIEDILNPLL